MSNSKTLQETFKQTKQQLSGHGKREVQILKDAFNSYDGQKESDIYGKGDIIEGFQNKMADYLGKESAVFFPSGTMAQQIALRIWCDEIGLKKVAYHPLSHLEIHESDGLKELHHIETVLLADQNSVISFQDVHDMEEVSCLLLELPQREIGGQLPDYKSLENISRYCRDQGIKLHLDGARLLEVLPYYKKTAAEICSLFDSVYLSVYKGIGGIAGAVLAGDHDFTEKSKVWKQRYGGNLISLYPYIISADYYFNQRVDNMQKYYEEAKELASLFNTCQGVSTVPEVPVSNMFHVHFGIPKDKAEQILSEIHQRTGIGFSSYLREINEEICYYEASIGDQYDTLPKDELQRAFGILNEKLIEALNK